MNNNVSRFRTIFMRIAGLLLCFGAGAWNPEVMAAAANAVPPVLWLKLDEVGGANAMDSSGNDLKAMLWKGPNVVPGVWVSGKVGGALDFNVTNYDYLSVGNVGLNTSDGGGNTMSFWMKWSGSDCNGPRLDEQYCLKFSSGSFGFTTGNGDLLGISSSGFSNQWVHVVAVFPNGTPNAANAKLYINGIAQTLTYRQGTTSVSRRATGCIVMFKGLIDDFRIYSRALTDENIADTTNASPIALLPCTVIGSSPVDYFAPEQAYGWALCVYLDNRIVSPVTFPQPAAFESDSIALSNEVLHDGHPTMKLTYTAKEGFVKHITVSRKDGWHIYPKNEKVDNVAGMGVWVYGNASGDTLEYVDAWGNAYNEKKVTFRTTIDWKGWKYLELPRNKEYTGARFWGLTVTMAKGATGPRDPIYFAKLSPSQSTAFLPRKDTFVDPLVSHIQGNDFHIVIELPDGQYEVELGLAEPSSILEKDIGFDVTSPAGKVLFKYQPGKKGGPWWRIPVQAEKNRIDLHFQSRKRCNAWLNALRLYREKKLMAEFSLGFDPKDEAYFSDADRVNFVPNPGFEVFSDSGQPIGWKCLQQGKVIAGTNKMAADEKVAHGGNRALRLAIQAEPLEIETATRQIWPIDGNDHYGAAIDYTRNYTFSAWVRGSDDLSGSVRLELAWLRMRGEKSANEKDGHKFEGWHSMKIDTLEPARSQDFSIKSGEWQQVKLSAKPPYGTDHVVFRVVARGEKGNVWLDDLRFDGFGDAPVEIIACQGGFHPAGVKRVIVATKNEVKAGGFFTLYPAGKQDPVCKKPMVSWGKDEWGRNIWIADFTDFTTEGDYELEASLPGLSAEKSHAFSISRRHYKDLIDKVRHYLYVARCGMAIPGWHDACHLDDAMDMGAKKHYDMTGGWHDAGSIDKQMGQAAIIIRHLSTIALEAPTNYPPVTVEGLALPEVLDEAIWGADQLAKMQLPDGRFFVAVNPSAYGDIVTSQNGIPGDYDDRILIGPYGAATPGFLFGLTRAALALKSRGKDYTRFLKALKISYPGMKDESAAIMVDIDMWRLTGDQVYQEQAGKRAEKYLGNLKNRDYYWRAPDYDLLDSLMEYALAFPESKPATDIKTEVKAFVADVLDPFVRQTPYEHVTNWNLLFPHTIGGTISNYELITLSACCLAKAYRLLGDKRCLDMADAQLQWIMGRNPMNNSMIAGVGYRFQMPSTAISYTCPAHKNGLITGAVLHYAIAGNGKLTTYYSGGVPRWFPVIYTSSDVSGHMLSGGEIWTPVSAMFMRACYELDQAMEKQKTGK